MLIYYTHFEKIWPQPPFTWRLSCSRYWYRIPTKIRIYIYLYIFLLRYLILKIYIKSRHLEAAGGWSWRPDRYRYRGHTNMLSCMSICKFLRAKISILISKIILGHLEAAGGWSWRPARYRFGGYSQYAFMYV